VKVRITKFDSYEIGEILEAKVSDGMLSIFYNKPELVMPLMTSSGIILNKYGIEQYGIEFVEITGQERQEMIDAGLIEKEKDFFYGLIKIYRDDKNKDCLIIDRSLGGLESANIPIQFITGYSKSKYVVRDCNWFMSINYHDGHSGHTGWSSRGFDDPNERDVLALEIERIAKTSDQYPERKKNEQPK